MTMCNLKPKKPSRGGSRKKGGAQEKAVPVQHGVKSAMGVKRCGGSGYLLKFFQYGGGGCSSPKHRVIIIKV